MSRTINPQASAKVYVETATCQSGLHIPLKTIADGVTAFRVRKGNYIHKIYIFETTVQLRKTRFILIENIHGDRTIEGGVMACESEG